MAFSDYEHCHYCVADKQAGRPLPDEHGYKGLYVGDADVPDHINVICSHHLKVLTDEIATLRDREAQHLARIADLEEFQSQWQQRDGNTPGYNLQKAKNYGAQAYEWKQKAIELAAREAQLLADINLINERLAEMREVDGRKSRMLYDRDVVIDTLRARVAELEAANDALRQPPKKHVFWRAGEPDCPRELKAPNGELHTLKCKVCGGDGRSSCGPSSRRCDGDTCRACVACVEAAESYSGRLVAEKAQHLADIKALQSLLHRWVSSYVGGRHGEDARSLVDVTYKALTGAPLAHYDDAKADAPTVDWQGWANGSCPEPGCSLANPHEQGAACVKPTAEGGEG